MNYLCYYLFAYTSCCVAALHTEEKAHELIIEKNLTTIIPALNYRTTPSGLRLKPPSTIEIPDLPKIIIKTGGSKDRLDGAAILNAAFKETKSTQLFVPHQTLIQLTPAQRSRFNYYVQPYLILAEKIEGSTTASFSLQQIQKMAEIIKKTGYADTDQSNFIHTHDGRIAFIDTELRSFGPTKIDVKVGLTNLLRCNKHEEDAKKYLICLLEKEFPDEKQ